MKRQKIPAIVFGGGIDGLGVARNLGREGIDVYSVVDCIDPFLENSMKPSRKGRLAS